MPVPPNINCSRCSILLTPNNRRGSKPILRTCTKCGAVKPLEEFRLRTDRPNGQRHSWCKACQAERARRNTKRWRKRNPEKWRQQSCLFRKRLMQDPVRKARFLEWSAGAHARRRARLLGAEGSFTAAQWNELVERFESKCYYCRKPGKMTRDHFIALSQGGDNNIRNIVPACKSCNSAKKDKDAIRFMAELHGW